MQTGVAIIITAMIPTYTAAFDSAVLAANRDRALTSAIEQQKQQRALLLIIQTKTGFSFSLL